MEPFVLANERVHLAMPTAADVDRITELCQGADVAAWTTVPSPYLRTDAASYIEGVVPEAWRTGRGHTWAIRRPDAPHGPVLGMVGITLDSSPTRDTSAEIGYWLAPEARGEGLMTQAARLVVDWAFDPEGLGLSRMVWTAFTGNWASRRVAWRLGFRVEGTVRGYGIQRGARRDAWIGTLLADDPREPVEPWPSVEAKDHVGQTRAR
ncbi:GNAT family N-acetyltransferase [Oerskovia jenensis]|uniref:GNAT family N-acetyltransferase n=1 Tax=Oerskovia jenensis TaxID=162169 RepID=UPI0036DDB30C